MAVRRRRLDMLERLLRENETAFAEAISADFGHRSPHETRLLEVFPSLEDSARASPPARLDASTGRPVSLWFQPDVRRFAISRWASSASSFLWNYPLYLAIGLTAALAAGNRALVKMSEFTPATAALLETLISRHFAGDEVAVVVRGCRGGTGLLAPAFDHLLFTGSTRSATM